MGRIRAVTTSNWGQILKDRVNSYITKKIWSRENSELSSNTCSMDVARKSTQGLDMLRVPLKNHLILPIQKKKLKSDSKIIPATLQFCSTSTWGPLKVDQSWSFSSLSLTHRCLTLGCLAPSCRCTDVHGRPWLTRRGMAGRCAAKRGELPYVKNSATVYLSRLRDKAGRLRGDKISAGRGAQSQAHERMRVSAKRTTTRKNKRRTQTTNARARRERGGTAIPSP